MRNYPRLEIEQFGAHLLQSGDLDPVYIALNGAGYSDDQKLRWLVAYAAYYNCAVACWMSTFEGEAFWQRMLIAAANELPTPIGTRWPRGHERRHFRGAAALSGVRDWWARHDIPERMFEHIAEAAPSMSAVLERAKRHRSIGNWLSFKVADLIDACMGKAIDQTDVGLFLYETPREALWYVWESRGYHADSKDLAVHAMLSLLETAFAPYRIPHKPGQPIDMFCLETIACKHGSHRSGHYPLNNDIDEINHGLSDWRETSQAVEQFAFAMPCRLEFTTGDLFV